MAINMPKLPFKLPNAPWERLGPRTRRVLRYTGLALLAIVIFVFALQMTFPYNRVKDKIIEALSDKYDVTIGGVDRGIMPGRVYFKSFTMRTRQTKPEETVTTFYIDKLEVDVGILSLLGGTISVSCQVSDLTIDQLTKFLQEIETASKVVAVTRLELRRDFKAKEKDLSKKPEGGDAGTGEKRGG